MYVLNHKRDFEFFTVLKSTTKRTFYNGSKIEQLQRQKTHLGMCDTQPKCILGQSSALVLTEHEIKSLGTPDSPLQIRKSNFS